MEFIILAVLFFLPAGVANASPVIANRIPFVNRFKTPIDFGKSWRGKRILGDNKTWRGLIFGTLMASAASLLIGYFADPQASDASRTFFTGFLLGLGALTGDAVESFFKRQRGIQSGKAWFPFDQTDYIIGGLLFVYPMVQIPVILMAGIFVIYFGLHLLFSYIAFLLGLKSQPI